MLGGQQMRHQPEFPTPRTPRKAEFNGKAHICNHSTPRVRHKDRELPEIHGPASQEGSAWWQKQEKLCLNKVHQPLKLVLEPPYMRHDMHALAHIHTVKQQQQQQT